MALLVLTAEHVADDEKKRRPGDRDYPRSSGAREIVSELIRKAPGTVTNGLSQGADRGLIMRPPRTQIRKGPRKGQYASTGKTIFAHLTEPGRQQLGPPPPDWVDQIGEDWETLFLVPRARAARKARVALRILQREFLLNSREDRVLQQMRDLESARRWSEDLVRKGRWPRILSKLLDDRASRTDDLESVEEGFKWIVELAEKHHWPPSTKDLARLIRTRAKRSS